VIESYWAALYPQTRTHIADFQKRYGPDEDLQVLQQLVDIRQMRVEPALASLQARMTELARNEDLAELAETQLTTAEALVTVNLSTAQAHAFILAGEALKFFNPREIWESVWRCHAVAVRSTSDPTRRAQHRTEMMEAQKQLSAAWTEGVYHTYSMTPHAQALLPLL
jgi:hypothetical protein